MSIKNASTVIFAAKSRAFQSEYRVLMLKRAAKSRFMPGTYVFPGGIVEEADKDPRWQSLGTGQASLSDRIAGLREAFEEANIFLTEPPAIPSPDWASKVHREPQLFYDLCEQLKVRPAVDLLVEWDHWITPEIEKYRYDTWFFMCLLNEIPSGVTSDHLETSEYRWLSPADALDKFASCEIILPPPTWITLLNLAKHSTFASLTAFTKQKREIYTNLPNPTLADDGTITMRLPPDQHYQCPEGPAFNAERGNLAALPGQTHTIHLASQEDTKGHRSYRYTKTGERECSSSEWRTYLGKGAL